MQDKRKVHDSRVDRADAQRDAAEATVANLVLEAMVERHGEYVGRVLAGCVHAGLMPANGHESGERAVICFATEAQQFAFTVAVAPILRWSADDGAERAVVVSGHGVAFPVALVEPVYQSLLRNAGQGPQLIREALDLFAERDACRGAGLTPN